MTFLERIIETKKLEVSQLQKTLDGIAVNTASMAPCRGFRSAILRTSEVKLAIVSEIKRASPSKGLIQANFDPLRITLAYERSGATAISVLTDTQYFQGSIRDLEIVHAATHLPILRKDFIIDESQILEARMRGADAVLLICSALQRETLCRLVKYAKGIGMDTLIEVHSVHEVDDALVAGADVIGINNRNLHTFDVSLETTANILEHIPTSIPVLSESGIQSAIEASYVANLGVHGVLIGESLMKLSSDEALELKLRSLQVPRNLESRAIS